MSIALRVSVLVLSLVFLLYVSRLISHHRLQLKYSLLWFALTIVMMFCALFPAPLFALSDFLGFEQPSNMIYFISIFFLLGIALSLTVVVSWQSRYIRSLVQENALNRNELERASASTENEQGKESEK